MEATFYSTSAAAAFALLGLWWVVVAERRLDWLNLATRRRQAYTVSLYFALPGIMSLVSLVSPGQTSIWRLTFGVAGTLGAAETALALPKARRQLDYRGRIAALLGLTLPFYVVIIAVAVSPTLPQDLGIKLKALETEAVAVSMLMFLGINFAWLLFFEPQQDPDPR